MGHALAAARVPGCSIALATASGRLVSRGFGWADLRARRPATHETIYHLFSGTKLFTAVAVLQLAERGLLALDDPVSRFIPEAGGARGVTMLHLLTHRSGLRDTLKGFLSVSVPPEPAPVTSEALKRYRIVPRRPPGDRVEYRNVNYALLGDVVTRVSGLEYRQYVMERVLAPLGMDAGFVLRESERVRAATGYIGRWAPMRLVLHVLFPGLPRRLYRGHVGSLVELNEYYLDTAAIGGLLGSAAEFGKFLRDQLTGGEGVLNAGSLRRMQTLVAAGRPGVVSQHGMALGWKVGRKGDRTFLNHEGGGAGFTSELRLYPDAGLGIAVTMNAMRMPATMRLADRLCEAVVAAKDSLVEFW